jgi:hypothetical protein
MEMGFPLRIGGLIAAKMAQRPTIEIDRIVRPVMTARKIRGVRGMRDRSCVDDSDSYIRKISNMECTKNEGVEIISLDKKAMNSRDNPSAKREGIELTFVPWT